jgi:hypothetical protein
VRLEAHVTKDLVFAMGQTLAGCANDTRVPRSLRAPRLAASESWKNRGMPDLTYRVRDVDRHGEPTVVLTRSEQALRLFILENTLSIDPYELIPELKVGKEVVHGRYAFKALDEAQEVEIDCMDFARWLVSLDNPDSLERRRVTVAEIIERAKEAL